VSASTRRRAAPYLALLLSCFLLTWQWDAHGLWDDELYTIRLAQAPTLEAIFAGAAADIHPPLHYLLMRGWIALAGPTDYAVRFASVASAWIALALAYRIGRQLFDQRIAQVTLLLLSLSPFLILYARMARYYAFAMSLGLLSLCLFVQLLRATERGDRRVAWLNLIGWVAAAIALLYTDYPTSIVLIGQNLFMLIYARRFRSLWPKWLLAQTVVVAGFLPWAGVTLTQIGTAGAAFGDVEFAQGFFGTLFKIGQPIYSFAVGETLMPWHPAATVGLLAVAILTGLGLRAVVARREWPHVFAAIFLLLPLAYLVGVSFLIAYAFPSRVLVALPFLYMLMAIGAQETTPRVRSTLLGGVAVAFVFGLANYYPGYQFVNPTYAVPTRAILRTIDEQDRPGDVIASEAASGFDYYYTLGDAPRPHFTDFDAARAHIETQRSPRVWLIRLGRDSTLASAPTDFVEWLSAVYDRIGTWSFGPVDPIYQQLKTRILGREVYSHKATVWLYVRRGDR